MCRIMAAYLSAALNAAAGCIFGTDGLSIMSSIGSGFEIRVFPSLAIYGGWVLPAQSIGFKASIIRLSSNLLFVWKISACDGHRSRLDCQEAMWCVRWGIYENKSAHAHTHPQHDSPLRGQPIDITLTLQPIPMSFDYQCLLHWQGTFTDW